MKVTIEVREEPTALTGSDRLFRPIVTIAGVCQYLSRTYTKSTALRSAIEYLERQVAADEEAINMRNPVECWLCKGEGVLRYETAERERSTGAVVEETTECTECFGVGKIEAR